MALIWWLLGEKSRVGLLPVLLVVLAMTGACTRTYNPPREAFTQYPVRQAKIPLRVGLNSTDELRQAKWERGDQLMPVGESIAMNAGVLARQVFAEVDVSARGDSAPNVDAILTPLVVYVNRTHGATAAGESITSIKIEWALRTPSGQPIWIETVGGQSSASTVSDPEKVLANAIGDVLRRSEEAFYSSRAIRVFAASRPARDRQTATIAPGVPSEPTAASSMSASLSPGARALVGTWTGTLTLPRTPGSTGGGDRRRVVEVVIAEQGGAIQWTMTGPGSVQLASGSASLADDGGAVLVGVFAREAGRLAGIPVQYHLRVLDRRLDGSGLTGSNEMQELSLTR